VEFVFSLPTEMKIRGKSSKWILKESMRGILPDEILTRGKKGFSIPIKNWLRGELKPLADRYLEAKAIDQFGLFDSGTVRAWTEEHMNGRRDHAHRLWTLIQFSMWAERFL